LAGVIVAAALLIATWGMLSLAMQRDPISSDGVPRWAAPVPLLLGLALLAAALWQQAIVVLRGRRGPAWGTVIALAGGLYLRCRGAAVGRPGPAAARSRAARRRIVAAGDRAAARPPRSRLGHRHHGRGRCVPAVVPRRDAGRPLGRRDLGEPVRGSAARDLGC